MGDYDVPEDFNPNEDLEQDYSRLDCPAYDWDFEIREELLDKEGSQLSDNDNRRGGKPK